MENNKISCKVRTWLSCAGGDVALGPGVVGRHGVGPIRPTYIDTLVTALLTLLT
jgi:hypothetical protein